jgi:hypothetical protein
MSHGPRGPSAVGPLESRKTLKFTPFAEQGPEIMTVDRMTPRTGSIMSVYSFTP